jgi:hypothetical protein
LIQSVYIELDSLARKIMDKIFVRFPALGKVMTNNVSEILGTARDRSRDLVVPIIDAEKHYYTTDPEYNGTKDKPTAV